MPDAVPIVGLNARAEFTPTGGTLTVLKNSKWTLVKHKNIKEAPNTTDGMLRARGLPDATGTVEGFIDATSAATLITTQLPDGDDIGVLKLYINATQFYQVTAILGDITVDVGGVNDLEKWSFPWMLQSGTVTDPV
jgi:hypothetical protein